MSDEDVRFGSSGYENVAHFSLQYTDECKKLNLHKL